MRGARVRSQTSDGGGGAGGAESAPGRSLRRRHARWGWSRGVHPGREFTDWIAEATAGDAWLREHPPEIEWGVGGVPPAEIAVSDPIVQTLIAAGGDLGQTRGIGGLDNWHDGATLTVEAGIPAVCFGPGDIHRAHTVDECVPIRDLVACAQRIALAALRFCG